MRNSRNQGRRWLGGATALVGATLAAPGGIAPSRAEEAMPPPPPSGPFVRAYPPRPPPEGVRACSLRYPVCVHGVQGVQGVQGRSVVPGASLLDVLASFERAWEVEAGALALPSPDPDVETGAFDVYVAPRVPGGVVTALGARDPRSPVDRASAFVLLDASLAARVGCALDSAVAEAVARASLFRVAPATDEGSARAESAYLARLAVPCAMGSTEGIAAFQQNPDRAIIDPDDRERDRGAQLFFWWLDATYGAQPGGLTRAIWALSPTVTPLGARRWNDEPDGFDVLRMTFKGTLTSGSTVEDLLSEFGVTRALMGPRENGAELPEARPLGAALSPRIDWTIDWPKAPRRLASPVGVAPTGSAYVWIRHAGAAPGARLRLEAAWEPHAALRWVAVKLDAAGRETARIPIGAPPRATEAQGTIVDLDAADAVLVVATNVGDPFAPFEPDDEVFEPHGWLLTVAAE